MVSLEKVLQSIEFVCQLIIDDKEQENAVDMIQTQIMEMRNMATKRLFARI